tara:strand:+ start:1660 stop:2487 length:828 start_codon:yes stop_codon:yes gene_type:complete
MARNRVSVSQVIDDFIITQSEDDFVSGASDYAIRNFALRGIREMGFDVLKRVRSIKRTINKTNNTVPLPDDFVDIVKMGLVGTDGLVYVFGENKHINMSQKYCSDSTVISAEDATTLAQREESKSPTGSISNIAGDPIDEGFDSYIFRNFLYGNYEGGLYGIGGANHSGQYRINYDQNRFELDTSLSADEVVVEYVADEARSENPTVHVYAEEALRAYIYYKLVERKSSVPAPEKARARAEYFNELRRANSRLSNFTKQEALDVIRRNFRQSPKV